MKLTTKLWIGIAVLIVLCPLGLILPGYFKAGSAWGEWETDELKRLAGTIPEGFQKLSGLWNAPMPDYAFKGWGEKGLIHLSFAYMVSGVLGAGLVALGAWAAGKFLTGSKSNFVERSIASTLSFIKESVFAEDVASRNGLLQSLDARIKTVTIVGFIVAAMLVKTITHLLLLYVLCLILAAVSRISLLFFLKRTWLFIPLFSLFIALPALFSFVTPGQALWGIGILVVTSQGLASASLFVSRVAVSVSFAVLLSLTTRHFDILKVLRLFGVPKVFVMVLGMAYRYIYLFVEIVEHSFQAVKSRVGRVGRMRQGQKIAAWHMASLWSRSFQLNEQVYQAMLSRGFQGESVVLHHFKTRVRDWVWLGAMGIIFVLIVWTGTRSF